MKKKEKTPISNIKNNKREVINIHPIDRNRIPTKQKQFYTNKFNKSDEKYKFLKNMNFLSSLK